MDPTENENLIPVGDYIEKFNTETSQSIPCGPIYQSTGLVKHIQRFHPAELGNLARVSDIIKEPDYIGKHPKEGSSIELVKVLDNNVMVCIKLDSENGYLYVASVYPISDGKLKNRINSGRLKAWIK